MQRLTRIGAFARATNALQVQAKWTFNEHRQWIEENPGGSLGELLTHINMVLDECYSWGDALILPHLGELGPELHAELSFWEIDEDQTFDYRAANFEELVENLEELVEYLGSEFVAKKLKTLAMRQIAAHVTRHIRQ